MNQKTEKALRKIATSSAGSKLQDLAYVQDRKGTIKVSPSSVRGVVKNLKAQIKASPSKGRR